MIRFNRKVWIAALGAGAIASFTMLPSVRAELVYENGAGAAASEPTQVTSQVNDRAALRQTLESSQKAQATMQAQPQASSVQVQQIAPAQAPTPVAAPAPVQYAATAPVQTIAPAQAPVAAVQAPSTATAVILTSQPAVVDAAPQAPETQNLSHAEIIRRERMREELKNEDVLQTRLEELRMKDEQKRTNQILAPAPADAAATAPVAPPVQQQVITAPVTERPGQPSAALPASLNAQGQQVASIQGMEQSGAVGTSQARENGEPLTPEKQMFSLSGRGGISNISSNNLGYSISPQFSAGIAASVAATDYIAVELGYTYSQYNVSLGSSNGFYQANTPLQSLALNQNVIDAGLKVNLLGPDSKIRPYLSGGFGYSKSYLNYNSQALSSINANPGYSYLGTDYNMSQYLGYIGAGMDLKITRNISVGVDFKYHDVLSSSQNNDLNNYAFYGNSSVTPDKQYVGGSLQGANFYTVMAGLTFTM